MDLLKTLLVYLTMVFVASVQTAPDPSLVPQTPTPAPTATAVAASATPTASPTPTPVPTPDITPNTAYKTVKVGDKGDSVKTLQRRLAELGYFTGEVDGVFGNQTRRAVERFQYYQGLSVDGIAGKRTLTVLYESEDVVLAPPDVSTTPTASSTPGPSAAQTTPPATLTPAPTFVPTATPAPTQTELPTAGALQASALSTAESTDAPTTAPTATPETTMTATPNPEPVLLVEKTFVLAADAAPLAPVMQATLAPEATPALLHPLQVGEVTYVPLLELLRAMGNTLIPGANTDTVEIAFTIAKDIYQINYAVDAEGAVINLEVQKNQTPQVLSIRDARLLDGMFYLPMTVVTELTGITFTPDETGNLYTVALPTEA